MTTTTGMNQPIIKAGTLETYKLPEFTEDTQTWVSSSQLQQFSKDEFLFDVETYPNYFLISFKSFQNGIVWSTEAFGESGLPTGDIRTLQWLTRDATLIGYNSQAYDIPMMFAAMSGMWCQQLKAVSDFLILGEKRPFEAEKEFGFKITYCRSIDLQPVGPNPVSLTQRISLKHYGARMGVKRLQELPYGPDDVISGEQVRRLRNYNINDLDVTGHLRHRLSDEIKLREKLGFRYKTNLLSKSDAQIAEVIIRSEYENLTGKRPKSPGKKKYVGTNFKYHSPSWVNFKTDAMRKLHWQVVTNNLFINEHGNVRSPVGNLEVNFNKATYTVGLGGLHSTEQQSAHFKDDEVMIIDRDVASYYPSILLNEGWYPQHLGPDFLQIYRELYDTRLAAKKAGDKVTSDSLKIVINGTFGKTSDKWSCMYDPFLLVHITITGQLALLMLIEMIEGVGIPVISANTDGIVMKCPKGRYNDLNQVIADWEGMTRFETEETQYDALLSRDVNNYFAIKSDVEPPKKQFKTKGAYHSELSLGEKDREWLKNNLSNTISNEAAQLYVLTRNDKKPIKIEDTIKSCNDIRKFLIVRQVRGGAVKDQQYLGKVVRWYMRKNEYGSIVYRKSGNTVSNSQGGMPLLELPTGVPKDIDYDWYIKESEKILRDVGLYGGKEQQTGLFD